VNIYKISCYSSCGSYFQPYLKSITVMADTKEDAIALAKEWMKKNNKEFVKPEEKWDITQLQLEDGIIKKRLLTQGKGNQ
jgi:hypothetical protein